MKILIIILICIFILAGCQVLTFLKYGDKGHAEEYHTTLEGTSVPQNILNFGTPEDSITIDEYLRKYNQKLITLEEYEHKVWEQYQKANEELTNGIPMGIACPQCGEELWGDKFCVLMSNPPQRNIWCPKCGWKGTSY